MLAAKFEELDMNIPMVFDVQLANKFKVTYHQLKGIENELLLLLDFDLMVLTPLHFLNQLHASGLVISSDSKNTGRDISEKTLFKVKEYAYHFCEAALESYDLCMRFPPSKVAAVCLFMARKACSLAEPWDASLEEMVGFKKIELRAVI